MKSITPTVGRVVYVNPNGGILLNNYTPPVDDRPLAAIVAAVLGDGSLLNLCVIDASGQPHAMAGIPLIQEGEETPKLLPYAYWMPYQLAQAGIKPIEYGSSQVHPSSALPSTPTGTDNLFIGTKIVKAEPMTRQAYNDYRGWTVPADEDPADDGYLVEYTDGGKPNVQDRAGYVSWTPKEQFDKAYRPYAAPAPAFEVNTDRAQLAALGEHSKGPGHTTYEGKPLPPAPDGEGFGTALEALEAGYCIARKGWNGKGLFVYLVPAASYPAQTGAAKAYFGDDALVPYSPYMALKGADGKISTWAPSGNDALTKDWIIVDPAKLAAEKACAPNADFPPHQQRVLEEKQELDAKAEALNRFFSTGKFNELGLEEKQRMRRQLVAMYEYATVLAERIAAF